MYKLTIRIFYNKYNYNQYNRTKLLKRPLYWREVNIDLLIELSDIIKKIL